LVTAVCTLIKLGLVTVTFTAGMTAPFRSLTTPSMVPVVFVWAEILVAKNDALKISAVSNRLIRSLMGMAPFKCADSEFVSLPSRNQSSKTFRWHAQLGREFTGGTPVPLFLRVETDTMHEILEARVVMQNVKLPLTAQPYQSLIVLGVGFFERCECLIALAQRDINRCQRHR
jgi:hypothetical protein